MVLHKTFFLIMKLKLYPSINLELAVNMGFEFTELVWIVELLELEQQQVFPFSDNSQYLRVFTGLSITL